MATPEQGYTLEDIADVRERAVAYGEIAELARLHGMHALAAHCDRLSAKYHREALVAA